MENTSKKESKDDVLKKTSDLPGLMGYFESALRRFRTLMFVLTLSPLFFVCTLVLGISLTPALMFFYYMVHFSESWSVFLKIPFLAWSLSFGYLIYGITLIFVVPLFNFLMPFRVKPWRGIWFSVQSIPWYVHNALTYLVRYTFLEFITPTPLNILFFKMMGMKIGKGVVINTTNISDPCLIEIGDYVTIGGSATLFAHYGQKGYLVISKTKIGSGSTIGLKASVMGGVHIGEKALVLPHAVLLPRARVYDGETVSGVVSLRRHVVK
ncbi:MAG: hypothetical protein D6797_08885 [Bdellovibrio sp.]|nr:MAG: hypothetical protein D6797_08885 [Bdellovibrio sp.]